MLLVCKLNWFLGAAQRRLLLPLFFVVTGLPALAEDIVVYGLDAHKIIIEGEVIHTASEVKTDAVFMHHLVHYDGLLFICSTFGYSQRFDSYCVQEER